MSRLAIGLVLVLALAVAVVACQKLPSQSPGGTQLPVETLTRPDAIPATWGNLVSATSVGQYPDLVQLWFQDEQKVIRVVVIQVTTMDILNARLIGRN
jgi:predicted component of type VI protein secretion system